MDTAEKDSVHQALSGQGVLLGQHDLQLRNLTESNQAKAGQISLISNKLN